MSEKEPSALHMLFGIATLGWLGYTWDTYMQMDLYGSVLAFFAGVTFIFLARESAPKKETPWLFGWNDDPAQHAFMRMPSYASIFVGPITRHAVETVAPDIFAHRKSYIAIVIVSAVIGICMAIYINNRKNRDAP